MTNWYVAPGGSSGNAGTSWASPLDSITTAYNSWMNVGDTCYVASNYSLSSGSGLTINVDQGMYYVSADSASGTPPATGKSGASFATASVSVIGAAGYIEGMTFSPTANGAFTVQSDSTKFKRCTFNLSGTTTLSLGKSGNTSRRHEFVDSTINLNGSGSCIALTYTTRALFRGGAITSSSTLPYLILAASTSTGFDVMMDSVDLTGLSISALVGGTLNAGRITFYRCKLSAAFAGVLSAASSRATQTEIFFIECDVAGSGPSYRFEYDNYEGETKSTTSVVRTGGATVSGFAISWQASLARAAFPVAYRSPEIALYNETVGSAMTITLEFLANAAGLTVKDVWMELSYLGDTASMKGAVTTTEPDSMVNAGTLVATSGAAWSSIPSGYTAYKLSLSVTPQQVGTIRGTLRATKVMNLYVDPVLTVS